MKKYIHFIAIIVAVIVFSGCASQGDRRSVTNPANTPTKVATSRETQPTAAFTVTPTHQPTPEKKQPSATPLPTSTPTPVIPDSLPTSQPITSSPESYQLTQPSVQMLNALMHHLDVISATYWDLKWEDRDQKLGDALSADSQAFSDLTLFHLQQKAISEPGNYLEIIDVDWNQWFFSFTADRAAVGLLVDVIAKDILSSDIKLENKGQYSLPSYKISSSRIELDHDAGPEWLLKIFIEKFDYQLWLVLDENWDHTYRKLNSDIFPFSGMVDNKILRMRDITGDGLTDLILTEEAYLMGTYFYQFIVYQGKANGFQEVSTHTETLYAYDHPFDDENWIPFEVIDNDGLPVIKTTFPENRNWGCSWDRITIYRWENGIEQKSVQQAEPVDTPECALAKAMSLTEPVPSDVQIGLLENAVSRLDPNHPEQFEKAMFAHYRLGILYTEKNLEAAARRHFSAFVQGYTPSPQSEYIQSNLLPLLEKPELSVLDLCAWGYHVPFEPFEVWWRYNHSTGVYNTYPGGEPVPEASCPFVHYVDEAISRIAYEGNRSPKQAIEQVGLKVQSIQEYQLLGPEKPIWLVLLDTDPLILVTFIPREQGPTWRRSYTFSPTSGAPIWLNKDVTGDGVPEIAVALKSKYYNYCRDETGQTLELYVTGLIDEHSVVPLSGTECIEDIQSFTLEKFLADQDGDGLSDILVERSQDIEDLPYDPTYQRSGPVMFFTAAERQQMFNRDKEQDDSETDIASQVLGGISPQQSRERLMSLMDHLQAEESYFHEKQQYYQYLTALTYELEGNEKEAVRLFWELAQVDTHTHWSTLAASRLQSR